MYDDSYLAGRNILRWYVNKMWLTSDACKSYDILALKLILTPFLCNI